MSNERAIELSKLMLWEDDDCKDAAAELRRLVAENESLRKDAGWQAIKTAPRDKTHVALLRCNEDGSVTYGHGYYMPMDGWQCWTHYAYKPPTHWMPLPPPPDAAKESK
jgi:hypothetical protein